MGCSHCHLPVRRDGQQREIDGETYRFCCYGCCLAFQVGRGQGEESEAAWLLVRLGVGAFLAMFIMLFSLLLYSNTFSPEEGRLVRIVHVLLWALATPVLIILGQPFLYGAWQAVRQGCANADILVIIGASSAYVYSAWQVVAGADAVYFDTVSMVLVLFTVGRYLEAAGRARAARSLAPMLAPERARATVVVDGGDREQAVRDIRPGAVVRVRPGERLPVDGVVLEGCSHCDEAVLSGQHDPRAKRPESPVYAGSVNGAGQLLVRATAVGADTRWGQIGRYVSQALDRKSLVGEIVDRAATGVVPLVILLALATLFYWHQGSFERGLLAALAVLVVACPCALGLAAPLVTAIGLGQAAQRGILLRGGGVLERLAGIQVVAFDKTGTLTGGAVCLRQCLAVGASRQELLRRAAGLAQGSEHPLAAGIRHAAEAMRLQPLPHRDIQARPGQGVVGRYEGDAAAMGSAALMQALGWAVPARLREQGMTALHADTPVYVAWQGAVRGRLGLTDTLSASAEPTVAALGRGGLVTGLLSGDTEAAVRCVAEAVGIETWRCALSPEDKVAALRDWTRRHGPAAMVGDGMNDGPVLAAASVGIAVGGATDLARETAEVVLPEGALEQLPWLLRLARLARRTIYANIAWALGYNVVALSLAASGLLLPIFAAALMAGSSLLVVVRSLQLGRMSEVPPSAAGVGYAGISSA